jgi:hypothetical protein
MAFVDINSEFLVSFALAGDFPVLINPIKLTRWDCAVRLQHVDLLQRLERTDKSSVLNLPQQIQGRLGRLVLVVHLPQAVCWTRHAATIPA